jgi:DNA-binding response OmpR family regulator
MHTAGGQERGATTLGAIMVVEDDPATAALLSDLLGDEGYAATVFPSAFGVQEAVRRLHPCAILLDLGLPYRSGVSLLADLKADPTTAPVPVIVVSALLEALPPSRMQLAAAVVAKPFAVETLLDALRAATLIPSPPVLAVPVTPGVAAWRMGH